MFGVPVEILVAAVAVAAIALYAIFGGADFGGGVWDVLASGPRRPQQQEIIGHAIGPVWETNHVWLIFMIVLLFTCFPPAFASISVGLYVPLSLVLVGIILRGAAYAFRSQANRDARLSQAWGHVFGIASVVSPFFFGCCVGGLTVGHFAWTSPFALSIGALAVALCAQLAAVFLTCEVRGPVRQDFRMRGMIVTVVLAALGAVSLALAKTTTPHVFTALTKMQTIPGIATAMLFGFVVVGCLFFRKYNYARIGVCIETVAILVGWYASQAPYLIPGELTYAQAASPPETLRAFLVLVAAGSALLVPSLWLLFRVFKSAPLESPV